MVVACISVLSLTAIFAYDLVTQSTLFLVKKVHIKGNHRVQADEVIRFTGLDTPRNLFKLNTRALEKKIASHPWIASATVKRQLSPALDITVAEHKPIAIVKIENIADILINTKGQPFKEYNPGTDRLEDLPVVTGLDLTHIGGGYQFKGHLFNAVMDFLQVASSNPPLKIRADKQTGITIESHNLYIPQAPERKQPIHVKIGFGDYPSKLKKAKTISAYIDRHFPERTIISMDVFNLKKVFVKTTLNDSGHNILEKGA